jgi:hypothetical protein
MHSPWKEASNRLKYGGLFSEHWSGNGLGGSVRGSLWSAAPYVSLREWVPTRGLGNGSRVQDLSNTNRTRLRRSTTGPISKWDSWPYPGSAACGHHWAITGRQEPCTIRFPLLRIAFKTEVHMFLVAVYGCEYHLLGYDMV